jgi:transglutaminase-like putative cysteine protease
VEKMDPRYLSPTFFIDCEEADILRKAGELSLPAEEARERAIRIFSFVRDGIRYNAFSPRADEDYRASRTLRRADGYCVQKAVLLVALCRAAGIPARLRFADIRGHLTPAEFVEKRGSNLFSFHGLADLLIEGRWVKATPTYDKEYCGKAGIPTVEFDGKADAMLPPCALDGRRNVEYLLDRGSFDDLPLDDIRKASASWKYMTP